MFLWRTDKNYPSIIIKYPLYLFFCSRLQVIAQADRQSFDPFLHDMACIANKRKMSRLVTKPTMACAPSKGSYRPGHPPSLIRMKKAWVLSYPLSAQWRLWLDWAVAQADLSLRWAHVSMVFCHEAAHMSRNLAVFFKNMKTKNDFGNISLFPWHMQIWLRTHSLFL